MYLGCIEFNHAVLLIYGPDARHEKGFLITRFRADGAELEAAPNGDERLIDTIVHEAMHTILAQATRDEESVCLRGAVEGTRPKGGKDEEALAYGTGLLVAHLVKKLAQLEVPI